ncbi:MAG: hypothetical protein AB2608_08910 [Candidatus Thiodiazotropha sp.]
MAVMVLVMSAGRLMHRPQSWDEGTWGGSGKAQQGQAWWLKGRRR